MRRPAPIDLRNPTTCAPMTLDERLAWYQGHCHSLERDRAEASTVSEYWAVSRELIVRRREYHAVWLEWAEERAVAREFFAFTHPQAARLHALAAIAQHRNRLREALAEAEPARGRMVRDICRRLRALRRRLRRAIIEIADRPREFANCRAAVARLRSSEHAA